MRAAWRIGSRVPLRGPYENSRCGGLWGDMAVSQRAHAALFRGVWDFYTNKIVPFVVIGNHAIGNFRAFLGYGDLVDELCARAAPRRRT